MQVKHASAKYPVASHYYEEVRKLAVASYPGLATLCKLLGMGVDATAILPVLLIFWWWWWGLPHVYNDAMLLCALINKRKDTHMSTP